MDLIHPDTNSKEVLDMILHFIGGKTDTLDVLKETKKYLEVRTQHGCYIKYRINKETGEVQDGTYHSVIKGLYVTEV